MCHASFPDNIFYVYEDQPYCKTHYHYLNNSLCNRCHQGIENLCAHTNEGWRFHPKCLLVRFAIFQLPFSHKCG
jgi:hypothetical protein